jgi:hypothetical protein
VKSATSSTRALLCAGAIATVCAGARQGFL